MEQRASRSEPRETTSTATLNSRQTSLNVIKLYKNFRLVWLGNFVAQGGQWLQFLTIGWLVLKLTDGNALLTGTVIGIRMLPVLFIGPWAGVLADRMDRRKLVMVSQLVMATSAILFALLVLVTDLDSDPVSGPLRWWHPFVYMVIAGIAHSFIQPVRQAMIANTVPRHALASALALNGMVYPSTRIIAPAIGGLLIAAVGFKWNFFLEAMAYVGIVLLLIPVKLPYREDSQRTNVSALASMKEGIRFVLQERRIVHLILLGIFPNFIWQPLVFMLPVFTTEVLGRGAGAGGILAASIGAGGVVAAVLIAGVGFVFRKGMVAFIGLVSGCLLVLLFALSTWYLVSIAILVAMGFSQYIFRVANSTLVQTIVPDEFRGRVMSIYMLDHGFTPVATLLISLAVHLWNPSGAFAVIGAFSLVLSVVLAITLSQVRRLE